MNVRRAMLGLGVALTVLPPAALAQHEMPEMTAPLATIAPTRVYIVTGKENWDALTGFGKDAAEVAMMNLMMVGGSGYEGMKMEPMKMGTETGPMAGMAEAKSGLSVEASVSPNPPIVGDNTVAFTVRDAQGKPVTGLTIAASVGMTNMDMGTTHPAVTETGDGRYAVTPQFTMIGPWRLTLTGEGLNAALDFNAGGRQKWTPAGTAPQPEAPPAEAAAPAPEPTVSAPVEAPAPATPAPAEAEAKGAGQAAPSPPAWTVKAAIARPVAGDNVMDITLADAAGRPVTGAKISAAVGMTSMDMGTARPAVKEIGGGKYRVRPEFTMLGPWRVTLSVTPPGGKPMARAFDFTVKQ